MTPHDRESAAALVERIERDGEWHTIDVPWRREVRVVDRGGELVVTAALPDADGRDHERDAADVVEARRLLPVMQGEIERLTRERDETRHQGGLIDRAGSIAEGLATLGVEVATQQAGEIERLHARLKAVDPDEREEAEEPLASISSRDEKCECCGGVVHAGTDLAAFVGGDGRQVFAHWGPCPEPDLWRVVLAAAPDIIKARPYEDAWIEALRLRARGWPGRMTLLRIRSRCTAPIDRPVPDGVECTYRQEPCGRPVVSGERCERHAPGGDDDATA